MARVEWIEQRMQNWVRWKVASGSGALGYASVNLSNAEMPREPYAEAPIPTSDIDASEVDDAVNRLPSELRATVLVHYVGVPQVRKSGFVDYRASTFDERLRHLAIAKPTLHARIDRAHRMLAEHFMARQDKQRAERARVEGLRDERRPV